MNNTVEKMQSAKTLFDFSEELFSKQVWIVLHNENSGSVAFLKRRMLDEKNYHARICTYDSNLVGTSFEGENIYSISEIDKAQAHIAISGKGWYLAYEKSKFVLDDADIFLFMEGWYEEKDICIVCGKKGLYQKYADFSPFITERMFHGVVHETGLSYCPECGMTYSTYRPNDEDASSYYKNYRDEEYQTRRQFYEPYYTAELNKSLADPPDGGASRRKNISDFLQGIVDFEHIKTILDYGGDRGQFIPDCFPNAQKYVYDISGARTEKDVIGIRNETTLGTCGITWDLILCNQCMEHLSDIKDYFSRLVECMTNDTYLYIEVPNERSWLNAYNISIHEHINMFSERAFLSLAEQHDLKMIRSTDKSGVRCLLKR